MDPTASKLPDGTRRSWRHRMQSGDPRAGSKAGSMDCERVLTAAIDTIPGLESGHRLIIPRALRAASVALLTDMMDNPKRMSKLDHSLSAARLARVLVETATSMIRTDPPPSYTYTSGSRIWQEVLVELRRNRRSWNLKVAVSANKVRDIIRAFTRARKAFLANAGKSAFLTASVQGSQGFHSFLTVLDCWTEVSSQSDAMRASRGQNTAIVAVKREEQVEHLFGMAREPVNLAIPVRSTGRLFEQPAPAQTGNSTPAELREHDNLGTGKGTRTGSFEVPGPQERADSAFTDNLDELRALNLQVMCLEEDKKVLAADNQALNADSIKTQAKNLNSVLDKALKENDELRTSVQPDLTPFRLALLEERSKEEVDKDNTKLRTLVHKTKEKAKTLPVQLRYAQTAGAEERKRYQETHAQYHVQRSRALALERELEKVKSKRSEPTS
ncbi:hypothetical protein BDP81DRAFT_398228 [Colletotrichum phormii]|uniref:Uncharacterized protein n=1 Tax=Colletotrichum phormii TaxID=359342 RepID=A0AAI9ZJ89_9PEZI|nr:uncharacterized protein BDP81DRAFT_398228 [Colletotrichum phormii]KAK1624580.1 hypothetical protein BDP81DRAFT_398228 [Colletotrichum phormii]